MLIDPQDRPCNWTGYDHNPLTIYQEIATAPVLKVEPEVVTKWENGLTTFEQELVIQLAEAQNLVQQLQNKWDEEINKHRCETTALYNRVKELEQENHAAETLRRTAPVTILKKNMVSTANTELTKYANETIKLRQEISLLTAQVASLEQKLRLPTTPTSAELAQLEID